MTGFGKASRSWPEFEISVEIRSVNSRYLDLRFRLSKETQVLEPVIRKRIQERLSRGRVELAVVMELRSENQLQLNQSLVKNYQQAARQAHALGVAGQLDVARLLQLPGVLEPRTLDLAEGQLRDRALSVIDQALEEMLEARRQEGAALQADLRKRLERVGGLCGGISDQAQDVTLLYREKLEKRVAGLRSEGDFDEARLAQEICYYAERADITEELTRLKTHVERFQDLIAQDSEGQLGRNLDFLCQEMNREVNTIGSKASKADISELAVEAKVEIEKIREQVQNIE